MACWAWFGPKRLFTSLSARPEASTAHYWAVVPAAGSGRRFGAESPKQYLEVMGMALVEHAIAPLLAARWIEGIVVALPAGDAVFPALKCARDPRVHAVDGGGQRASSVLAGLAEVSRLCGHDDLFILVHDAARPALRSEELERLREQASDDDGGLLALPVADTLKRATGGRVAATVDRRELWRAQTPQLFRLERLRMALERALADGLDVTDEASAMEAAGFRPRLVEGHASNLKVTTPDDLPMAEFWLRKRQAPE